jgi:hypothetical protein
MTLFDHETRLRYAGRLEPGQDENGFPRDFLVLYGLRPGEQERRVGMHDHFLRRLWLVAATLDERARLDRSAYRICSAPPGMVRRHRP